jgi:hypothetical protein
VILDLDLLIDPPFRVPDDSDDRTIANSFN